MDHAGAGRPSELVEVAGEHLCDELPLLAGEALCDLRGYPGRTSAVTGEMLQRAIDHMVRA